MSAKIIKEITYPFYLPKFVPKKYTVRNEDEKKINGAKQ